MRIASFCGEKLQKSGCPLPSDRHMLDGKNQRRRGFTILELLVTFGIISTLAGLILPAVGSAREAARQLQCKNQLKQIGLALHSYHETNRCLPAGWQWETTKRSAYGWAVPLLPYLDQRTLYGQVDRNQIIQSSINLAARNTTLPVFLCPSDIVEPTFTLFDENEVTGTMTPIIDLPTANYMGVFGTLEPDDDIPAPPGDGAFREAIPVCFAEITSGLSNTIIVGERTMSTLPSTWLGIDVAGDDAPCQIVGSAINPPNSQHFDECEYSSRHAGGANYLRADGHVRMVSESIDPRTYQNLARRATEF